MAIDKWVPVVGFPGYEVSDSGQIRSRLKSQGNRSGKNNGILQGSTVMQKNGSPKSNVVGLRKLGRIYHRPRHRIILESFIGPCPDGMEACHNDGNPLNNILENLRWDTHSSNMKDCVKHGTNNLKNSKGEKNLNSKLTASNILRIRAADRIYGYVTSLSKELNVSRSAIKDVLCGKTWRHLL